MSLCCSENLKSCIAITDLSFWKIRVHSKCQSSRDIPSALLVLLMERNERKVPSGGMMYILSSCFKKMLLGCRPGISFLLRICNIIIVSREVCISSRTKSKSRLLLSVVPSLHSGV
jgi:hypothetical protein